MREYNVHEVLAVLQKYYITDSQQMVTRWIREGKIIASRTANRKAGYIVYEEDLIEFIEEQRPGLMAIMEGYEAYIKTLKPEDSQKDELEHIKQKIKDLEDAIVQINQHAFSDEKACESEIEQTKETSGNLMQYKDFERISKDIFKQLKANVAGDEKQNIMKSVYQELYEQDGSIKPEHIAPGGKINCPITHNDYKQQKRVIKNMLKHKLDDQLSLEIY